MADYFIGVSYSIGVKGEVEITGGGHEHVLGSLCLLQGWEDVSTCVCNDHKTL